jgi:hypothetical protein
MAWLVRGKTECPLCGQIIEADHKAVMFPPLYIQDAELRAIFSDNAMHRDCFSSHPLKDALIRAIRSTYDPNDSVFGAPFLAYIDELDAS